MISKYIKTYELKKPFRDMLLESPDLRKAIAVDIYSSELTIKRRALKNSKKLTQEPFLKSFRKRAGIDKEVELVEEMEPAVYPEL